MTPYSRKTRLLITGGNGQVASALCHHPAAEAFYLMPCSRNTFDITTPATIDTLLTTMKPDIVINTAAYTAVDRAEEEREQALRVNYHGAKQIAIACETHRIPLIHLSTDYIFDGEKNLPYCEEDAAHPLNQYGMSKWLGEQAIRAYNHQHVILRISSVFSQYGHNFYVTIRRLAQEKETLRIVDDQIVCPTYAGDIAHAILSIATHPFTTETYHYCSDTPISWHAFAMAILDAAAGSLPIITKHILPVSTMEYGARANRPRYTVLDCSKIQTHIGLTQPAWQAAL